ncbi:hypothetical protein ACFFRR_004954 [Megaselia abdita]
MNKYFDANTINGRANVAKVTYGVIFGSIVLYQLKKAVTKMVSHSSENVEDQDSFSGGSSEGGSGSSSGGEEFKTKTTSDKDVECECKCKSTTQTSYDLERFHFYP